MRLLPPAPAAFFGTFAAFLPTAGAFAIVDWCCYFGVKLWRLETNGEDVPNDLKK